MRNDGLERPSYEFFDRLLVTMLVVVWSVVRLVVVGMIMVVVMVMTVIV